MQIKMAEDFKKHEREHKNLDIDFKKVKSYYFEYQLIFLIITASILGFLLYFTINVKDPIKLVLDVIGYHLTGFAIYCVAAIVALSILAIRYNAKGIRISTTLVLWLSLVTDFIDSRLFIYTVSILVALINSYFITAYIFHYIMHTLSDSILCAVLLAMIDVILIGYAILTGSMAMLMKGYAMMLTQQEFQEVSGCDS